MTSSLLQLTNQHTNMSNELAQPTTAAAPAALSMFANAELFALVQRQAQLIASSDLIPKQFQGNVANCAIALEMASRLGASPFAVIQNLDVIHGRPSWRSVFLMGMVNASGRFSPLQFKIDVTGPARTVELEIERWDGPQGARKKVVYKRKWTYTPTTCVAYAKSRITGEDVFGPPVSYDMALEEGWVAKDGSKWLTEMRELMLRYRAASFFAKVHAADLTLGMQTAEEAYDAPPPMRNVTPPAATTENAPNPYASTPPDTANDDPPAAAPASRRRAAKTADPQPEPQAAPAEAAPTEPAPAAATPDRKAFYAAIKKAAADADISTVEAEKLIRQAGLMTPDIRSLAETSTALLGQIAEACPAIFSGTYSPFAQ